MQEADAGMPTTDLRAVMRRIASTVAIITTRHGGVDYGLTATSVTSVSLNPPVILACINRETRLHAAVLAARYFTTNFLAENQSEIARVFGTPNTINRFSSGAWILDERGPRLINALAEVTCELAEVFESGTHSILIGHVKTTLAQAILPLLYCDGEYAKLGQNPSPGCSLS